MCLITYSPNGAQALDWEVLGYSAKSNKDGFGLAWYHADSGRWNPIWSLEPETLPTIVSRLPQDAPLVIHQRYATHGKVNLDNAHPFVVSSEVMLFHNGVISGTRAERQWDSKAHKMTESERSDTHYYVTDEFAPLIAAAGFNWLKHKSGIDALENRIGYGSILAITIDGDPEPTLINEWGGHWNGDIFYSNTYSLPVSAKAGQAYGSKADDNRYQGLWWEWDDEEEDANAPRSKSTALVLTAESEEAIREATPEEIALIDDHEDDEFVEFLLEHGYDPYEYEQYDSDTIDYILRKYAATRCRAM